jgi:energy-coupling factor transporter ATP-binding protein EcfA2
VLIIGPSGSGKSTLALQLAKAGWAYLSDDELLLSLTKGEVEARGFRSFFAVNAAAHGLKTCFEPEVVLESERRLRASPRVLLFTRVNGEHESRLHKLTQADTMTRLLRACPWATYDTAVAGANLKRVSQFFCSQRSS